MSGPLLDRRSALAGALGSAAWWMEQARAEPAEA